MSLRKRVFLRCTTITATLVVVIVACSVTRSESIDIQPFTIPQGNYYDEQSVGVPSDVQSDAVEFESATINYEILSSNDGMFGDGTVELSVYISSREEADDDRNQPAEGDERVFTVTLESDDDLGTGSANSEELVDILNSGQESFVVALDVEKDGSVPPFDGGELTSNSRRANFRSRAEKGVMMRRTC